MMDIQISTNRIPSVFDVIALYVASGWGAQADYDAEKWHNVLVNSKCITAYDERKLVGIIRYLTDGFQDTQVCEFAVLPEYQKQGIGTRMLEELVGLYGHTSIYASSLKTAEGFFNKHGLASREAMVTVSRKAAA